MVTVSGGTITAGDGGEGLLTYGSGSLTVSGGTLIAGSGGYALFADGSESVTVTGGTFTVGSDGDDLYSADTGIDLYGSFYRPFGQPVDARPERRSGRPAPAPSPAPWRTTLLRRPSRTTTATASHCTTSPRSMPRRSHLPSSGWASACWGWVRWQSRPAGGPTDLPPAMYRIAPTVGFAISRGCLVRVLTFGETTCCDSSRLTLFRRACVL